MDPVFYIGITFVIAAVAMGVGYIIGHTSKEMSLENDAYTGMGTTKIGGRIYQLTPDTGPLTRAANDEPNYPYTWDPTHTHDPSHTRK